MRFTAIAIAGRVFFATGSGTLYMIGINPLDPLDPSPFALAISGILMFFSMQRYKFMQVSPIANDLIFDNVITAIFIFFLLLNLFSRFLYCRSRRSWWKLKSLEYRVSRFFLSTKDGSIQPKLQQGQTCFAPAKYTRFAGLFTFAQDGHLIMFNAFISSDYRPLRGLRHVVFYSVSGSFFAA